MTKKLLCGAIMTVVAFTALAVAVTQTNNPIQRIVAPTPQNKAEDHLDVADARCSAAVDAKLSEVRKLFANARGGAKQYADEVLGWDGKWALTKQAINDFGHALGLGGKTNDHADYLESEFKRRVLDPDDLKNAIHASLQSYLDEIEAVENETLVKLRADVFHAPATGESVPLEELNKEFKRKFAAQIDGLTRQAAIMVGQEAATFGASQIISNVATNVALAVAADLGISSTIIGGGALVSVATLGAGIIVGIIVDQIIGALLREFGHDPAEKVTVAVTNSLDTMERSLTNSLQSEMRKLHEQRSKLRRHTITTMLKETEGAK